MKRAASWRHCFNKPLTDLASPVLGLGPVDDHGECVDGFAVHQDRDLDQIALFVVLHLIIEAGVAARNRFEAIVEIEDDLV